MDSVQVDLAIRGAATTVLGLLAGLIWFSRISLAGRLAFAMTAFCVIARTWSTLPEGQSVGDAPRFVLRMIGTLGPFFTTWFLMTIFLDNARHLWLWLLSAALVVGGLWAVAAYPVIVPYVRFYAVGHYLSLLALVLVGMRDDLQNARRRVRPAIAAFLVLYGVGIALTSRQMEDFQPRNIAFGQSLATLLAGLIFAFWSLKVNAQNWPGETVPNTSAPNPPQGHSENSILIKRINAEMQAGVWQLEGLTVGALAQRVKAPEYQVRRAINQVLGHRNFASFINSARIEAAKAKLSDPEGTDQTILEIAFDVGFASLGPFNRAFREITGQSPTDFRRSVFEGQSSAPGRP